MSMNRPFLDMFSRGVDGIDMTHSKLAGEGLVQQRFLQRFLLGELLPGEAGEALGLGLVHAGRLSRAC